MRRLAAVAVWGACAACTAGSPAAPANQPPAIGAMTITPAAGMQQMSSYSFAVTATDPEGDGLTFQWTIDGQPYSGTSVSALKFQKGGDLVATVTVTDARGAAASKSQTFPVGTLAGTWTGTSEVLGPYTATLTQDFYTVRGSVSTEYGLAQSFGNFNEIFENREFNISFLIPGLTAFRFTGALDPSNKRATGILSSNDFQTLPFEWTRVN